MTFKKTNSQFSLVLHSSVVVSLLLFFGTLSVGQVVDLKEQAVKKVNQPESIHLLELLKKLQAENELTFIFDEKIIQDKTVVFDNTARQAINEVLLKEITRQTNLQFNLVSNKIYTIRREKKAKISIRGIAKDKTDYPMIGANITILNQRKGVTTDEDGSFEIIVKPGRHSITASYVGYESMTKDILVEGYEDIDLDFVFKKHLKLEEILVVGNRFLPKTFQETAVPVDVINQDRLNQSNQYELAQVLQYETPSFHSATQTISDGTDHVDPISLKGLGPDQVLVLVNGKRRHFSSLDIFK